MLDLTQADMDEFLFQDEESEIESSEKEHELQAQHKDDSWKILIVDDEKDIHFITKMAFKDFTFENKKIEFYSAYSAAEAKEMAKSIPGIALILLDVVMEADDAGLQFVKYLRHELKNHLSRIVLRTGQPGIAPENIVILDYDINDYKEKTELTQSKLTNCLIMALRSYRDLLIIEENKNAMSQIMKSTQRFVPGEFLEVLNKPSIMDIKLGDHVQLDMTILFLDMRGFTTTCEPLDSDQNFRFINNLLARVEPFIIKHGGFIDKYIGDAILALYSGEDQQYRAVMSSYHILQELNDFNKQRAAVGEKTIRIGISLHTGPVTLGTIGFHDRMDCTVISDIVNTASKLEKMNKLLHTQYLITESVFKAVEGRDIPDWRRFGLVSVPGKAILLSIVEIYAADKDDLRALKNETRPLFNRAISLYEQEQYSHASQLFQEILSINPDDRVVDFFIQKCNEFNKK